MDLTPIQSSNIQALGYDAATRVLGVRFQSGAVWHYQDVPDFVYQMLCGADSCGREFARHVKGVYPGVEQPRAETA